MHIDAEAAATLAARLMYAPDAAIEEEFATAFLPIVRSMVGRRICRSMSNFDDIVQDATWTIISQVKAGELRDPNAVLGYAQTIVRNRVRQQYVSTRNDCSLNDAFGVCHPAPSPESELIRKDMAELEFDILQSVSATMSPLDLEILTRFYIQEQTKEEVCEALGITETQFRLAKSRAKLLVAQLMSEGIRGATLPSLSGNV